MSGHGKLCPRCRQPADADAFLCEKCGYRFRTLRPPVVDRTQFFQAPTRNRLGVRNLLPRFGAAAAVLVLLLVLTNPTRQEYLTWARGQFQDAYRVSGDNPLAAGLTGNLVVATLDGLTRERNLVVARVFWLDFQGQPRLRALGIVGQIIALDSPTPAPPPPVTPPPGQPAPMITEPFPAPRPSPPAGMQYGPMSAPGFRRRTPTSELPPPPSGGMGAP
jgi:hypothetical protein